MSMQPPNTDSLVTLKNSDIDQMTKMLQKINEDGPKSNVSQSERALNEEEIKDLDAQYLMGYLSWVSNRFSLWIAFKKFFAWNLFNQSVEKVFFNIGFAIGCFFMKKFWL